MYPEDRDYYKGNSSYLDANNYLAEIDVENQSEITFIDDFRVLDVLYNKCASRNSNIINKCLWVVSNISVAYNITKHEIFTWILNLIDKQDQFRKSIVLELGMII